MSIATFTFQTFLFPSSSKTRKKCKGAWKHILCSFNVSLNLSGNCWKEIYFKTIIYFFWISQNAFHKHQKIFCILFFTHTYDCLCLLLHKVIVVQYKVKNYDLVRSHLQDSFPSQKHLPVPNEKSIA